MSKEFDVLVVGSGAAGLTAALNLAETRMVGVIAKGALGEGASGLAQGGIAESSLPQRRSRTDQHSSTHFAGYFGTTISIQHTAFSTEPSVLKW